MEKQSKKRGPKYDLAWREFLDAIYTGRQVLLGGAIAVGVINATFRFNIYAGLLLSSTVVVIVFLILKRRSKKQIPSYDWLTR